MKLELRRKPFIKTKVRLGILIYIKEYFSFCYSGFGPDPCCLYTFFIRRNGIND